MLLHRGGRATYTRTYPDSDSYDINFEKARYMRATGPEMVFVWSTIAHIFEDFNFSAAWCGARARHYHGLLWYLVPKQLVLIDTVRDGGHPVSFSSLASWIATKCSSTSFWFLINTTLFENHALNTSLRALDWKRKYKSPTNQFGWVPYFLYRASFHWFSSGVCVG